MTWPWTAQLDRMERKLDQVLAAQGKLDRVVQMTEALKVATDKLKAAEDQHATGPG